MKTPAQMYEEILVPAIFRPWARVVLERAAPKPGERLLDLACGTGIIAREAAPRIGAAGAIVAVDLRPGMLDVARALPRTDGATVEWRQGDATELALPDGAFDVVICQQGLQFFPDRPKALREMRRVTAAGGRLVLNVWRELAHQRLWAALGEIELRHLGKLGVTREDLEQPFSLGDKDALVRLVTEAGFAHVDVAAHSLEASFPSIERFVADTEFPYAAVIPAFVEDRAAFDAFVDAVQADARDLLESHRDGDGVKLVLHSHVLVATA